MSGAVCEPSTIQACFLSFEGKFCDRSQGLAMETPHALTG